MFRLAVYSPRRDMYYQILFTNLSLFYEDWIGARTEFCINTHDIAPPSLASQY